VAQIGSKGDKKFQGGANTLHTPYTPMCQNTFQFTGVFYWESGKA